MRAYRVAYDGQPYYGFQRQPDVVTVEGKLLTALDRLGVTAGSVPEGYAAAGRTDAGVSAVAQTVAFDAPDWLTPPAFNSELPGSVRVWASTTAPADFHATHDASERRYTYYLHGRGIDEDRARNALDGLTGEHDFHNLTPDDEGTVRDLEGTLVPEGEYLVVELTASGFCRQLVRRVVGLVAEIGRGESALEKVDRALAPESLEGPDGVAPAPAYPLVLTDVAYPAVDFDRDETATESARKVFSDLRAERRTSAHVSAEVLRGLSE